MRKNRENLGKLENVGVTFKGIDVWNDGQMNAINNLHISASHEKEEEIEQTKIWYSPMLIIEDCTL